MPKSNPKPVYLTLADVQKRLGYKTSKSVYDLVRDGKLTPHHPAVRTRSAPRVLFLESEVNALAPQPNRLSRTQAAEQLGIHVRTLDRLVARGVLKAHPASGGTRGRQRRKVEFDAAEVEALKNKME